MLSKELFLETIELIKKKQGHEEKLIEALETCSPGDYCSAYIYSEYEDHVVKLLHETMGLSPTDDIIEYWMWECDFGKTCILTEKDTEIDLTTAEKLYDYIKNMQDKY